MQIIFLMIDKKSIRDFRKNLRHFERELDIQNNSACCCGVSLSQCHALMELDKNDNVTLNELCSRLYLDKSTLSRTVENLVNMGLVLREVPKDNRREIRIRLTMGGESVCNKINEGNDDYFQKILSSLPSGDQGIFLDLFSRFVSKMIELNNH